MPTRSDDDPLLELLCAVEKSYVNKGRMSRPVSCAPTVKSWQPS